MMTPDLINGLFEALGSVMLWRNVLALYKDKQIKGVRIASTAFFMAWGYWNMYYYPSLGQWLSFLGGVSITTANTVWVIQMIFYTRRGR
jgi:hypothetical protein